MKTFSRFMVTSVTAGVLLGANACKTEEATPTNPAVQVRELSSREARIVRSSNDFAFRAFTRIREADGEKNLFISPLSISSALAMAYNGAGSTTKEAIRQVLDLSGTEEEINQSFKSVTELLTGIDQRVTFTNANSIWHRNEIQLQPGFRATNQQYFNAEIQGLDFGSPAALNTINGWVKDRTQGRIEKIIDNIRQDHMLFLINAIYFKGTWTYPFDKKQTQNGPFRLENGTTRQVPFMRTDKARYLKYQDNTKTLVDLPYGNGQFSMTILLPAENQKVSDILPELSITNLNSWLENASETSFELHLPKFSLEYEKQLKQTLSDMGMAEAFSNQADFSRMIEGFDSDLAIDEVKHKTFVEVNEEGTEAAAATSVGIVVTSLPPSVRLDKPFVFLIREKATNTILFIGQLMEP